ncbi:hypothetical protein [Streptomyces sp. NPDC046197]|uniref:hypothetical protein n=1 Tax=Streptomyces sp. NPDC046197 TaxID=3154337 RepID=UPI0033E5E830
MKAKEFLDLVRDVSGAEPHKRERGADEVPDRLSAYSPVEAAALATLLAAAAACEKSPSALEAQLHAILEMTSTGHVEGSHLTHLREIHLEELPEELRGYVTDLLEG